MLSKILATLCIFIMGFSVMGCDSSRQPNNVTEKTVVKAKNQSPAYKEIPLPEHNVINGYYTKLVVAAPYTFSFKNTPLNGVKKNDKMVLEAKSRIENTSSKYGILFSEFDNMALDVPEDGHKYIECSGKAASIALAERFLHMVGVDVKSSAVKEYAKEYKIRNINDVRAEQVTASFFAPKIPEKIEMKLVRFRTPGEEWMCFFFYIKDAGDTKDCVENIIKSIKLSKK